MRIFSRLTLGWFDIDYFIKNKIETKWLRHLIKFAILNGWKNTSLASKNSSLYQEDRSKYHELLFYAIILNNQICYNRRDDYISWIDKSVTNELDFFLLKFEFFNI